MPCLISSADSCLYPAYTHVYSHVHAILFYYFTSPGNIRLEDGKPTDLWYSSCVDLVMSRFNPADYDPCLGVTGIVSDRGVTAGTATGKGHVMAKGSRVNGQRKTQGQQNQAREGTCVPVDTWVCPPVAKSRLGVYNGGPFGRMLGMMQCTTTTTAQSWLFLLKSRALSCKDAQALWAYLHLPAPIAMTSH